MIFLRDLMYMSMSKIRFLAGGERAWGCESRRGGHIFEFRGCWNDLVSSHSSWRYFCAPVHSSPNLFSYILLYNYPKQKWIGYRAQRPTGGCYVQTCLRSQAKSMRKRTPLLIAKAGDKASIDKIHTKLLILTNTHTLLYRRFFTKKLSFVVLNLIKEGFKKMRWIS